MNTKPESFAEITERFASAADWLQKTGWPTRTQDVELAHGIYVDWLRATDRDWIACGERDRYPLIVALDEAFRARHDQTLAEHLCVVFTVAFELRTRKARANRRAADH